MTDKAQPNAGQDADALAALVNQLSQLLADLLNAARASTDAVVLMKINSEYGAVQSIVSQATQAQMAADDDLFAQAIAGLKVQATMLTNMEAQIAAIVADVATAAKIVGYITQAITLIGKL
jgi:phenylpyruvate tautomerase PptA (4-oxalocrotonate tautomerase family)